MRPLLPLLLAALPVGAAAQEARQDWFCADATGRTFEVLLWTPGAFDVPLHCVLRLDLPVAPCAPDGGWGLSAPGPDPVVDRIATEAKALAHEGGWFFARVGPSRFVASASVGSRPPLALEVSGETVWRLSMDLASGQGSMFDVTGETPFACHV